MLSEKNLAKLSNTLQAPVIVQDLLSGQAVLTDDVHYGIHDLISDYQPDSALLCIALSAKKIAGFCDDVLPTIGLLGMECERIIHEYSTLWLQNAHRKTVNEDTVFETLIHVPEDLESLAELLEISSSLLEVKNGQAAALCEILSIQARAHALVAESFIMALESEASPDMFLPVMASRNDNVIPFPAQNLSKS